MSTCVWLFAVILPVVVLACNLNMGSYKLHNGQGEMSYLDREKSALYSEQGVWVSWKVPIPRHWDPKTGQIRKENPGKRISSNWGHWNQMQDENPPLRTPSPKEIEAANFRVIAPDPYREFMRNNPRPTYAPEEHFFLSAGISPEHDTSVEAGVIKGKRPSIPAGYIGALQRPSFNFQPEDETTEMAKPQESTSSSQVTGSGASESSPPTETMAVVARSTN